MMTPPNSGASVVVAISGSVRRSLVRTEDRRADQFTAILEDGFGVYCLQALPFGVVLIPISPELDDEKEVAVPSRRRLTTQKTIEVVALIRTHGHRSTVLDGRHTTVTVTNRHAEEDAIP